MTVAEECWDCQGEGCFGCDQSGQMCGACGEAFPYCESNDCGAEA